jgi:hypothetical protein
MLLLLDSHVVDGGGGGGACWALQQSIEDVRYFDPEFTSQTPKDSFVEASHFMEGKQSLFDGFSYVSTSSFEQLIKQRRKVGGATRRLGTPSEVSTATSTYSESTATGSYFDTYST